VRRKRPGPSDGSGLGYQSASLIAGGPGTAAGDLDAGQFRLAGDLGYFIARVVLTLAAVIPRPGRTRADPTAAAPLTSAGQHAGG
jgi:hypothetical protein